MSLWTIKSPLNAVVKKTVERLDHVGAFWKENSRQAHPLKTLINYAKQSNLSAETLNQENQTATVIHNSWRTELRNLSRRKRPPDEDDKSNKWRCLRTANERIKKKNLFTAMVLVSLILNTQIGTSLGSLEQRIPPPFIKKHWKFVRLESTIWLNALSFAYYLLMTWLLQKQDITLHAERTSRTLFQ